MAILSILLPLICSLNAFFAAIKSATDAIVSIPQKLSTLPNVITI